MEGRTLSQAIQRKIKLDIALYTVGVPIAIGVVLFVINYFKGKGFELKYIGPLVLIYSIQNLFIFYFELRERLYLTKERITGDSVTIKGLTIKNLLSKNQKFQPLN